MDSYELNKIFGAILATCLFVVVMNIAAGAVFAPHKPAKPGFEIAVKEEAAAPAEGGGAVAEPPITTLLASASADAGKTAVKKCESCHTFEKGGANKVGPNLWGIVDRPRASHAGFNYSAAMKAKGGTWTIEEINAFIKNPKADIPGTAMAFAGVARAKERADILVFLNTLGDSPKPLPTATGSEGGAGDGAAPAAPEKPAAAPPG